MRSASALAQVLPTATKNRRVGLITYGPGPYNQCNVKLDLKPTPTPPPHHERGERAGAGRQDATHLGGRAGGGGAELSQTSPG